MLVADFVALLVCLLLFLVGVCRHEFCYEIVCRRKLCYLPVFIQVDYVSHLLPR